MTPGGAANDHAARFAIDTSEKTYISHLRYCYIVETFCNTIIHNESEIARGNSVLFVSLLCNCRQGGNWFVIILVGKKS